MPRVVPTAIYALRVLIVLVLAVALTTTVASLTRGVTPALLLDLAAVAFLIAACVFGYRRQAGMMIIATLVFFLLARLIVASA